MRFLGPVVGPLSIGLFAATTGLVLFGLIRPGTHLITRDWMIILGSNWRAFLYVQSSETDRLWLIPIYAPLALIAASGTLAFVWWRRRARGRLADPGGFPVEDPARR